MKSIGFALGSLYRVIDKFSKENFDIVKKTGTSSIEISCIIAREVDRLFPSIEWAKKYARASVHLPTDIRYRNDDATKRLLDTVCAYYQEIGAELAVVHPDLIDDGRVFDGYNVAWAAENMDNRKSCFRSVEDMRRFFLENPSWNMVFDVNHCFSNDTSMKLAEDLTIEFHDRIKEIHLSGFAGYHDALFETKQEEILRACLPLDAPIIIESTFDDPAHVQKEFEYVSSYFRENGNGLF